jgi:hypothetical protein
MQEVRFEDGCAVVAYGARRAQAWLPLDGQVVAKLPPQRGNCRWLREGVGIRSPRMEGDRWSLPRNCLVKLVTAAIDRYGHIEVYRDMSRLSRCTSACLQARGLECDCSCMGEHHGEEGYCWFERVGDVMVSDRGAFTRTTIVYGPKGALGDAGIYADELHGRRYRADPSDRRDWPQASQFMCAGCMSARASVWDHCHTHGYVRAPLCGTCNTRHWSGWSPERGRPVPSRNVDTSYYRWCPEYQPQEQQWSRWACSN